MRNILILLGTASMLAACSGGSMGADPVGSAPPPAGGTGSTPTPTATDIYAQFAAPVDAKTYQAIGGVQTYSYITDDRGTLRQEAQVYAGNASSVRDSNITVAYDPRDAIFTLTVNDPKSGASATSRFQDPASRTNFGGSLEPQWGTPNLNDPALPAGAINKNINYLQSGGGDPLSPYRGSGSGLVFPGTNDTPADGQVPSSYDSTSFFYEKPGSSTKYVTFAGYVRNSLSFGNLTDAGITSKQDTWHLERGAFAYGAQTAQSAVPVTGSGSYSGSMLGTMVYNPTLDNATPFPTLFQWLSGTSNLTVDFAAKTVGVKVAGYVLSPQIDRYTKPDVTLAAGTSFAGQATATIDLVGKGGFSGSFGNFSFTSPDGKTVIPVVIAGSSVDGAFFGPKAEEVGGGFRVVGGTPDQRIDILGAFTGKK